MFFLFLLNPVTKVDLVGTPRKSLSVKCQAESDNFPMPSTTFTDTFYNFMSDHPRGTNRHVDEEYI